MGKVSRRPTRAARHEDACEFTVREFVCGETRITLTGPLAADPFDHESVAETLEELAAELRKAGPLRGNVLPCQIICPSPLREAA